MREGWEHRNGDGGGRRRPVAPGGPAPASLNGRDGDAESPGRPKVEVRRVTALFRPYRGRLAAVLLLIAVSAGLGIVPPFLLRDVLDVAIPENDDALLVALVAGMIGVSIATGALGVVQTWLSNLVGQRVMHDLRAQVYRHLQRLSLAFFTRTRTGEIQSRIANDIGGVQTVVTNTATSIVSNVTTVSATIVAMVALDWRLTLVSLLLLPVFVWISPRVGNASMRPSTQTTGARASAARSLWRMPNVFAIASTTMKYASVKPTESSVMPRSSKYQPARRATRIADPFWASITAR